MKQASFIWQTHPVVGCPLRYGSEQDLQATLTWPIFKALQYVIAAMAESALEAQLSEYQSQVRLKPQ